MSETLVVPKDGPIELKLADGSVVKGANIDDAFKALAEAKVHASAAIKEKSDLYDTEKANRERLQQELDQVRTELDKAKTPPPPPPKPVDPKEFNKERYFQLLGEDPMKAQNYVDSYRFGIENPDEVPGAFNNMRAGLDQIGRQVDVFAQQNVTAAFLAQHPEYPQGDALAAQKLTERVTQLVGEGMPYNANVVEFAYYQLVNADVIKPLEPQETTPPAPAPESTPNPSLSGGSSLPEDVVKAETMSDKDLYALMQSKGMIR